MDLIKQYIKNQNKQKLVTHGYIIAALVALVFSLINNSSVNASVTAREDLSTLALEEALEESIAAQPRDYAAAPASKIKSLFEMFSYSREKLVDSELTVASGDNFNSLMKSLGFKYGQAHNMYNELKKVFDARKLRAGQKIIVKSLVDTQEDNKVLEVRSITINQSADERFVLERNIETGEFAARAEKDELMEEINTASGIIDGNLSVAMSNQEVPNRVIADFISVFAFSVDFRRDLRKGDNFEIIYENYINQNGEMVKTGNILYAALTLRKDKIALYRFEDNKGKVDYYNEKGVALKKTLDRKPLAFRNARVSSPFGRRRHPIYRDVRIHWGIDYAAPRGTPVFAAGDGVVQAAKWNGGYGKYIKIRHNSEYSTAYGHLNGYASRIAPGTRVKQGQIIAYVGNTGKSTGPHLHYEVIKDGRRTNPATIRASTGENLAGENLAKFKQVMANFKETHKTMFAQSEMPQVARAGQ